MKAALLIWAEGRRNRAAWPTRSRVGCISARISRALAYLLQAEKYGFCRGHCARSRRAIRSSSEVPFLGGPVEQDIMLHGQLDKAPRPVVESTSRLDFWKSHKLVDS